MPDPTATTRFRLGQWWWNLGLGRKATLAVALSTVVFVPALAGVVVLSDRQTDLRAGARDDRMFLDVVTEARILLLDADRSVRGFVATGDTEVLAPYEQALAAFPALEAQGSSVAPPTERPAIEELFVLASTYVGDLDALVTAGPPADPAALRTAERSAVAIAQQLEQLRDRGEARVAHARKRVDELDRWIFAVLLVGAVLGAAAALVGARVLARSIVTRVRLVRDAADRVLSGGEIGTLEEPADDEIGQLVRQLRLAAETLMTQNAELARSRDEALTATRAKDEFLSRMSHELRTPMSAILGFGQLLQLEDLDDDDRASVDHIVKAGRHLLDLINDLLDISRISSGNMPLSMEPTYLREAMSDVVDLLGPQARERSIDVHVDVAPSVVVMADRQRLKQVILNLYSNAIKYNSSPGRIEIDAAGGDDLVRLTVTDTGPGMSPEGLARLFTPFERLDAAARGIDGTGVGLALSRSLVEAMSGRLGVDSEPGVGSSFWVELRAAAADDVPDHGPAPSPNWAPSTVPGERVVLYVEDNLANVRVMQRLVRDLPVRLETTSQGRLAVELAKRIEPAAVLLDLHLPDIDGDEVLHRLRADPDTAGLTVVVLSADASAGTVRRLLELGADAFLTKPIDIAEVTTLLHEVIDGHRPTVGVQPAP